MKRLSLVKIQSKIESLSIYRFEMIMVLKQPVLKLLHLPEALEIYIELNKGTKTINPYISVVSVNTVTNEIERNNLVYDLDKILIYIARTLVEHRYTYVLKEKLVHYTQEKLNI